MFCPHYIIYIPNFLCDIIKARNFLKNLERNSSFWNLMITTNDIEYEFLYVVDVLNLTILPLELRR